MLNAGWAPTGSRLWYLQRAVQDVHLHTEVMFTLIANMLDAGFGVYDWPTWAKDTDPESEKADAELAKSVFKGFDNLLGKW